MRYYDLTLMAPGSTKPFRQWTTHPNGKFDPNALLVEFDIPVSFADSPVGGASITIHGVSIEDLSQSTAWGPHQTAGKWQDGMLVTLKGGMLSGLPLANPKQAGMLLTGAVYQAFGNWEGTEMYLSLSVTPSIYNSDNPGNFVLNWRKGTELGTALKNCLEIAYPTMPVDVNISTGMVLNHDEIGIYHSLNDLGSWLLQHTQKRLKNPVRIASQGGRILAIDSKYSPTPAQIAFTDLVGQPTWIQPGIMQAKFIMRGDLQIGGAIQMPKGYQDAPGFMIGQAAAYPSQSKRKSTFSGPFSISSIRHVGNSRAPDGSQWVTVVNAIEQGFTL